VAAAAELGKRLEEYMQLLPAARAITPARHDRMPYRVFLAQIGERLRSGYEGRASGYESAQQLRDDIALIATSLRANKGVNAGLFYVERLLHGDLGRSYIRRASVTQLILSRFPATAILALSAMALSLALGIPMGMVAAAWRGRALDNLLLFISLAPYALMGLAPGGPSAILSAQSRALTPAARAA